MKHLLLFAFIIIADRSFSQVHTQEPKLVIKAKDAYKHLGEYITVYDSVYSVKLVHDSIAVCQMGAETNTPRLTAIFISTYEPWDYKFYKFIQQYRIWFTGTITGTKDAPMITMHNTDGLGRNNARDLAHGHN